MCGPFKTFLCSCIVLVAFSISMPSQNLPALQKDGSVTLGELANGISYYIVTNPSMKGVADFALVRKGLCDTLSAREELVSLPHFNKTVPYKFLSAVVLKVMSVTRTTLPCSVSTTSLCSMPPLPTRLC